MCAALLMSRESRSAGSPWWPGAGGPTCSEALLHGSARGPIDPLSDSPEASGAHRHRLRHPEFGHSIERGGWEGREVKRLSHAPTPRGVSTGEDRPDPLERERDSNFGYTGGLDLADPEVRLRIIGSEFGACRPDKVLFVNANWPSRCPLSQPGVLVRNGGGHLLQPRRLLIPPPQPLRHRRPADGPRWLSCFGARRQGADPADQRWMQTRPERVRERACRWVTSSP